MKTHQIQMVGAALRRIGQRFLCGVALLLPLCATSCSSDDDDDDSSDELQFVQVRVTHKDGSLKSGNVYLFKVSGYNLVSEQPNIGVTYSPTLSYTKGNGDKDYMFPVSDYGGSSKGELNYYDNEGCFLHSIYWSGLSSIYGTPKAGDDYIVYLRVRTGTFTYVQSYHRFTISQNSKLVVNLSATDGWDDGEWSISKY